MHRRSFGRWFSVAGLSLVATCAVACGSSDSNGGGSSDLGGGSGACFPTDPSCGLAGSECLAMVDNSTQSKFAFRVHQLIATAPAALTGFVQSNILDKNVPLDLQTCYQYGHGWVTWLFQLDTSASTLTIGGGPPMAKGAAQTGTCFVDFTDATSGVEVKPATAHATIGADGKVTADVIDSVALPMFLDDAGQSVVVLPLHKLELESMQVSADHNCIGKFNGDTLDPALSCVPAPPATAWTPGGSLQAYITVEESDKVLVKDLNESLCVLLAGDPKYKDANGNCTRTNGVIDVKGDWDAASNTAGGAEDAFHLVASWAAGAMKVSGTATKLDCSDSAP
jgi:hypothetical protein